MSDKQMKAVHYEGPFKVSVKDVPLPKLEHPDDAIIKVTTAAICGSDLHMYQGRTAAESGLVFGHENMGIVTEVGSGVTLLKKGDRIVLPFNVADGRCRNCENGKTGESICLHQRHQVLTNSTAFCTGVNPGFAGGAYGYVAMGPYQGGQAQYLRVPYADFNALVLPPGTEHEADFALLADIFPTGWHGLQLSGFQPGDSVAVFGAGPVGLMAAYSAVLRGASKVFVVDQVKERLDAARKIGCEGVDFTKSNPVEQIIELNGGEMVDRAVDAVGYQAVDKSGNKEQPNIVLDQLIQVTRPTGGLGIPGLYVPSDPGAPDSQAAKGQILISFGKLFEKGLFLGTGQCNVKAYNRQLRDLIVSGRAKPSFVVSHEVDIDDAVDAYEKFDKRIDGYTKSFLILSFGRPSECKDTLTPYIWFVFSITQTCDLLKMLSCSDPPKLHSLYSIRNEVVLLSTCRYTSSLSGIFHTVLCNSATVLLTSILMLGGPQTNTHVRRPVHSLLISLSMNGMSGLPYSVLQPVFLDLTAAGKKANRMRFFWNSMGCCGRVSRGEAKGSDDGGGDTRPLRDALLKGSRCACGSGLIRSSFSRLSAFSLSGSPAASSMINAEFLFVLAEMVESRFLPFSSSNIKLALYGIRGSELSADS
ncbi:S-glutathione dehydrogenase, partial [Aureobasidium melanogenum]